MNLLRFLVCIPTMQSFGIITVCLVFAMSALGQEGTASRPEQLPAVEVEAPSQSQRNISAKSSASADGFGYAQPVPSGLPFSDYSLTSGEVVSATGSTANLATVPSAISVVENRGIYSLGKEGLSDVVSGQAGVWSSGFAGNPFDAPIVVRGFSNESTNRVGILMDGVNLNLPRQEANTNFIFPELIERVEVTRGDAVIPLGDKSIGGAINVIVKKPRQNPGLFFGAEAGSWGTDREWAGVNLVRDTLAAGIFLGRYSQEGWRIYYGNNKWEEPFRRPGPWSLYNVQGSLNWKITPRLTFDLSCLISDQRLGNYSAIDKAKWDRRDIRDIQFDVNGGRPFDDFPEERWDRMTIARLLYEGGLLGNLEITGTGRRYDRSIRNLFTWTIASDQRWTDFQFLLNYYRTDRYRFIRNDLTLKNELADGRFVRESRGINLDMLTYDAGFTEIGFTRVGSVSTPFNFAPTYLYAQAQPNGLGHSSEQNGDRQSLSYSVINQTRLWDRLIIGLGYRIENYDLKDLYSQNAALAPSRGRQDFKKSASQYSLGFVYDRELGSNVYYRHSRTYRFPNFDDMINLAYPYAFAHPSPVWQLQPEEGTLKEYAVRHWFTSNIYTGVTYYELDMDNEIYFGPDPALAGTRSRNLNVPQVSHSGVEVEAMARITPGWTLKGNYTKQKVIFRSNWQATDPFRRTTEDKWLTLDPAEMANISLAYENKEWGFSALLAYHYVGTRYMVNDIFNQWPDLEPAKWGDIAFSQTVFEGMTTLYFGVNNVSDRQYAIQGSIATIYPPPTYAATEVQTWWPNAGRTYYFGMRTSTDFHRMRLPSTDDLRRMQNRLYGTLNRGADSFSQTSSWIRGFVGL
jgi:iron complex outermembrane recepter protein